MTKKQKVMHGLLLSALMLVSLVPVGFAVDTGTGIGLDITTEEFPPLIWLCDNRVVVEDCVEAGRKSDCSDPLYERTQNYAFEGEQIEWKVLVMDKNKVEQIQDVVATIGSAQGTGNDIEVECGEMEFNGIPYYQTTDLRLPDTELVSIDQLWSVDSNAPQPIGYKLPDSCNARILEEKLHTYDPDTMDFYKCIFTVETQDSMFGEHFITIEAISTDGEATIDENEYWFLNPNVGLLIDGSLTFEDVRPGTISYSDTLVVSNDADVGSGVLLDMFISGTDFYDPASSGAKCPTSNRLKLSQDLRSQANLGHALAPGPSFGARCNIDAWLAAGAGGVDNNDHLCFYATSGAYSTATAPNADAEGYRPIVYSDQFLPDFYNDAEIIWNNPLYSLGNVLAPGADIAITFKLGLPEPCVGDFSDGDIYFWGEAV